jgi:Arc/MetJ-type ribon-helix-helix transcriptional regulator
VRRETGESRSAVIRRSIELMLGRAEETAMVREYVAGYLTHPEGRAEIDAAMGTAAESLAEEPWE